MSVVLVTGATGMLGKLLTKRLRNDGHEVKTLTTRQLNKDPTQNAFLWNIYDNFIEQKALDAVDTIIHLAGANIGERRWTAKNRQNILHSRVATANMLLRKLEERGESLPQFISASGIGFYPDPCAEVLDENDGPGSGFLSEICLQWEAAAHQFERHGSRVAIFRFGPVLSANGGLLKVVKQTMPIRLLPVFGNRQNHLSWIHIQDAVEILCYAVNKNLHGTFNATATNPSTQIDFLKAIAGNKLCFYPWIPGFVLKLFLGERAALPLTDQKVSNKKLLDHGYVFRFQDIQSAMKDLLHD